MYLIATATRRVCAHIFTQIHMFKIQTYAFDLCTPVLPHIGSAFEVHNERCNIFVTNI